MVRIVTILSMIFLLLGFGLQAQNCTPDPQYTEDGIHPDTSEGGLDTAWVGQSYSQLMTIIVPEDTTVSGVTVQIDSVHLDSISGLPPNFTYDCEPASCTYPGNSTGCLMITAPAPPSSDVGNYPLKFHSTGYTPGGSQPFVYEGYEIDVVEPTSIRENSRQQEMVQNNAPNPFNVSTVIRHSLGNKVHKADFDVVNVLGEVVNDEKYRVNKTNEEIQFHKGSLSPGIYLYRITLEGKQQTHRMVIR